MRWLGEEEKAGDRSVEPWWGRRLYRAKVEEITIQQREVRGKGRVVPFRGTLTECEQQRRDRRSKSAFRQKESQSDLSKPGRKGAMERT